MTKSNPFFQEDDEDLDAIMAELQAEHEGKKAPPTAEELKVQKVGSRVWSN